MDTVRVNAVGAHRDHADGCPDGLLWPDGIQRCWRHTDEPGQALVLDLAERATRLGIPAGISDLQWPYGPNIYIDMRQRMVEWAERHGLTYAPRAPRCVDWPRFGRCRHDGHTWVGWLDHVTAWKRDGQPAALLAQPYVLSDDDIAAIVELAGDSRLFVDVEPAHGCYGGGTRPIAVWRRTDAAPVVAWDAAAGHTGDGCVHCAVCDACAGSGRVCRECGLCVEHAERELATRQARYNELLAGAVATKAHGRKEMERGAWWAAFRGLPLDSLTPVASGMPCARLLTSPYAQRVPGTGRMYRPARTYVDHSLYDVERGRWSE